MEWMLLPLKRYADFSGRSRRKEYWMFYLLIMIVTIAILLIGAVLGAFSGDASGGIGIGATIMIGLLGIFFLGIIVPSIAVQVRRFHDQDKSGWFLLLSFIPYVGGIVVFIFMCLEGTKGPNRFGADPKMDQNVGDVFN